MARFERRPCRRLHLTASVANGRVDVSGQESTNAPGPLAFNSVIDRLASIDRTLAKFILGRQAFLTSQNPLLLDYLDFESAAEVQSGFVLCERVPGKLGSELVWRNPTEAEAGDFFSAYETGIQRVSDILINKGFW